MYGAILGDIIGSPFEFDRGDKTKDFTLFTNESGFTDDSVMTAAVAEALIAVGPDASETEIKDAVTASMREWGKRYPYAGYGGRFRHWLNAKNPKPYNSYGNGSAMRVSAVGWLYTTLERTREVAVCTAEVTHNHPEGIKGAEAAASCIFLARNGADKEEIKEYVSKEFGYNLNRSLDEIRPTYHHVESCQQTVPEAIIAFLESENYEDAVRNAVSLGGDTDTLAAITGSIAEAYYDMSEFLREECRNRVSEDILNVIRLFDETIGRTGVYTGENEDIAGNSALERAINYFYEKEDYDSFLLVVNLLCNIIENDVIVPFVAVGEDMFSHVDIDNLKKGDTITLDHDVIMRVSTVTDENDEQWFCFFTNEEEFRRKRNGDIIIQLHIREIMEFAYKSDEVQGLVVNPFGKFLKLDKEILEFILNHS